jgi:hypothetical protein
MAENSKFPSRTEVEAISKEWPPGTKVELVSMDDPYMPFGPGEKGVVDHVDSIGTIHVRWECGSGLGVVAGVDKIKKI